MDTRILIADTSEDIVKSVERGLFGTDFELLTALSSDTAHDILDSEEIDIMLCGLDLAKSGGNALLERTQKDFPSTDRVILSAYSSEDSALRAITKGLASTYLTKPPEEIRLLSVLENISSIRRRLANGSLLSVIHRIEKLPSLPDVYTALLKAIDQDKSVKDIVSIIEQDISVASKVLTVANCAYYGFMPTTSLVRAVMVIGLQTLKDIVLTFSIAGGSGLSGILGEELSLISSHSLNMNRILPETFRIIAGMNLPKEYASCGITHDIGKLIMLKYLPDHYLEILKMKNAGANFHESELELGYEGQTPCEFGAFFLKLWHLPEPNCEPALFHHNPSEYGKNPPLHVRAAYYANIFANYADIHGSLDGFDSELALSYGFNEESLSSINTAITGVRE
jgi:HD-like signal output (HDOD) protein